MWFCRKHSKAECTDYRSFQIYCQHREGHFALKISDLSKDLEVYGPSYHLPLLLELIPFPSKKKTAPTWRGGLVDYCVSLSLRNNSMTHGQQREELLYMHSCGLDRTPGE